MTRQPDRMELVTIGDDVLRAVVWPGKGADILGVIDVATGVDVLFTAPWGRRDPASVPPTGSSEADWLARYAGGWQVLVPNAGPARDVDGVMRGYHGEAALLPWTVTDAGVQHLELEVDLLTAPLRIRRRLRIQDGALHVSERVHNVGADAVTFSWVHHPAFGAPFVDGDCVIATGATTVITDATAPGTDLAADVIGEFPAVRGTAGSVVDLTHVPGPGSRTARFAALTGFTGGGWFSVTSPNCGFAVRLDWDDTVLSHAWFWQECNASAGFPWYRRVYTIAIEPANVLPGTGRVQHLERGGGTTLDGGQEVELGLRLSRSDA